MAPSSAACQGANAVLLRQCLESELAAAVTRVDRRALATSSSYAAEAVTVRLANGEALDLFLKDFGSSRVGKDQPEQRRERELCLYRDLLARAGLGTARYYGSCWDDSRARFWLLLEFVHGTPLESCAPEHWGPAAAWLARLHGYMAQRQDCSVPCAALLRHDARFFWTKAEGALEGTAAASGALARRLARVLDDYQAAVTVMTSQPPTLVHGSYKPRHILVGDGGVRRICPVDWELAAVGSSLYDLGFLVADCDASVRDGLLDAYRTEATAQGLALPDREGMRSAVDCFRLHKVLKAIGGAATRRRPESRIATLVAQAERLGEAVLR